MTRSEEGGPKGTGGKRHGGLIQYVIPVLMYQNEMNKIKEHPGMGANIKTKSDMSILFNNTTPFRLKERSHLRNNSH